MLTAVRDSHAKLPEGVSAVYRGAHGETRAALRVPLPGAVSVPVAIPPRALLTLGYAFQAAAFMAETPSSPSPAASRSSSPTPPASSTCWLTAASICAPTSPTGTGSTSVSTSRRSRVRMRP